MPISEKVYFQSFKEISKALNSTLAVNEVLDQIVRKITEVMKLKGATIRLINFENNTLELVAAQGLSQEYLNKGPVDLDKSVAEALAGRPVAVYDATKDSRMQYPKEAKEEGIASMVTCPMKVQGKVIGVMRLVTGEPREFTREEVDYACDLADLAAQAITNAQLFEDRTRELKFLKEILEISKVVNSTLDVQTVLHLLVKTAIAALGVKAVAVRLLDEKRQILELVASYGLSDRYVNKGPMTFDQSIVETMTGKVAFIYDVTQDPRVMYIREAVEEGIKSILSVPITLKGKLIGALRIYTGEFRSFTDDEITFISSMAEQAALAMENARMYQELKGEHEELMKDMYSFIGYTRVST